MTSNTHPMSVTMTALIGLTAPAAPAALAQPGWVLSHQKISDTEGGFTGILDDDDRFGKSAASLGDLDGDGVGDLAVGAIHDDDGCGNRGAVWVLFLNKNGTVKSHQKISDTEGGFTDILHNGDDFGSSAPSLGYEDLNDHNELRRDPLFSVLADKPPKPDGPLASSPSCPTSTAAPSAATS